jgi:hypothetical protein
LRIMGLYRRRCGLMQVSHPFTFLFCVFRRT